MSSTHDLDVRVLLDNDQLLKEGASRYCVYLYTYPAFMCEKPVVFCSAFAQYNMEQFTPAKVSDDTVN